MAFLRGLLDKQGRKKLPNLLLVLLVIFVLVLPFIPANKLFWDNIPQAKADAMANYSYRKPITFNNLGKVFQTDTNYTLTSGLVSYYKLEDKTDFWSTNNLTEHGTPTYVAAKVNNGGQQGSNNTTNYWNIASNMGIAGGAVTFAFWINFNSFNTGWNTIFEQDSITNQNNYSLIYNGTSHVLQFERNKNNVGAVDITETVTLSTGTWYHIVATYDGTNMRLYRNNALTAGPTAASGAGTGGGENNFSIGAYGSAGTALPKSSAIIDEFGLWSRALNTTEIGDLYNAGAGQTIVNGTALSSYPVLVTNPIYNESGLVASYHLDGNLSDSSGNGFTLTNVGSTPLNPAKFGSGADFGTGNATKFLAQYTNIGINGGAVTIAVWVKINAEPALNTQYDLISEGGTLSGFEVSNHIWYQDSGGVKSILFTRLRQGIAWDGPTYAITLGTTNWYYIVYTYDGTNIRGYVNNALVAGPTAASGTGNNNYGEQGTRIGARVWTNGASSALFSSAIVDEARFYNRVISSAEMSNLYAAHAANNYQDVRFIDSDGTTFLNYYRPVDGKFWVTIPSIPAGVKTIYMVYGNVSATDASNIANAPSGLVGDWNMDELSGSTAYDSSGNNYNGTATGTTIVSGKFGNANNWGATAANGNKIITSGSISLGSTYTISAWVNYNGVTTNGYVIDFGNNNNSVQYQTASGVCADNTACDGGTLVAGQWYNIVVTKTGAGGTVNIYVNGAQTKTLTGTSNVPGAVTIGNYGLLANGWTGSIDEVRVYNRVLSSTEIRGLYNYPTTTLALSEDPISAITVTSVSPPVGPPAGGTPVTIGGTNFATAYRRAITVTNTGSAVNDYQLSVTNPIYNESGLVGSYHLDSNANDSSGNGNNLTNNGSTPFNAGKFGSAADGGSANGTRYLSTTNSLGIDGGAISFSIWANITTAPASGVNSILVDQLNNGTHVNYMLIYQNVAGVFQLAFRRSKMGVGPNHVLVNYTLTVGTWYHLVGTYDGTTMELFINNVSQGTAPASGSGTQAVATGFAILNSPDFTSVGSQPTSGLVDEVRVYNRAISSTEVSALYAAHAANNYQDVRFFDSDGVTPLNYWLTSDGNFYVRVPSVPNGNKTVYIQYGTPNVVSGGENNSIVPNYTGMVGYWYLDGNSADSSRSSYNLTNNGSAPFNTGKFGSAADFGASNATKYLSINSALTIRGAPITISLWTKIETPPTSGQIEVIAEQLDGTTSNVEYYIAYANSAGTLQVKFVRNAQGVSDAQEIYNVDMGTTNWHHIVGTYDGSLVKLYFDGVSVASSTHTATGNYFFPDQFQLGHTENTYTTTLYYSGLVDEARVYNRALSAAEVSALYTYPTSSTGTESTVNPSATFGGIAATGMTYSSSTSIGGTTPAHALGPVTVSVMNPDGSVGSLLNGFTFGAASNFFLLFD